MWPWRCGRQRGPPDGSGAARSGIVRPGSPSGFFRGLLGSYPGRSHSAKKNPISRRALGSESEAWIALRSLDSA